LDLGHEIVHVVAFVPFAIAFASDATAIVDAECLVIDSYY
jgi:hypothetical protein